MDLKSSVNSKQGEGVWSTLPNVMTFLRLCAVPISLWLIWTDDFELAFWIFLAAALTDWADGFFARRWGVVSRFGQLLDPVADKALVVVVTVSLGVKGILPFWFVALVFTRDFLLLTFGLYVLIKKINFSLKPTFSSKVNTFSQLILLAFILFMGSFSSYYSWDSMTFLSFLFWSLIAIVSFTTVFSGIRYFFLFLKGRERGADVN